MALRGSLFRLLKTQLNHSCQQSRAQSVAVLGAPFSRGQKRRGVEHGPKVIRDAGLIDRLSALDYSVHDFGDLTFPKIDKDEPYMGVRSPRNVGAATKKLSGAVSRAIGAGHTLVMLGGDHSLAMGSVEGHAQQCPDLCVIWVDAHADLNTPMTSPSGNLHGQPVAFMLKELQDKVPDLPGFGWMKPFLTSRDIVYIGLLSVMDLVEVNPILGATPEAIETTASLAVDVIASSLGQTREGAHGALHEIPAVNAEDTEQLRL
ncbi:hypothetical protein WMY93_016757 [Mugilogobius chulae]|uniref:Arginase n=1 Tax=Mugilogobius chulae TaxID=88201 RepID=A0AAW0NWF7_9GOBI